MEVIASIATVAQLVDLAFKAIESLVSLYKNLKKSSERLGSHLARIETLYHTVHLIEGNELLTDSDIKPPLEQLILSLQSLEKIAQQLLSRLSKGGVLQWRRVAVQNTELKKLEESLRDIESDKSTLLLGITRAHAEAYLQDRQQKKLESSQSSRGLLSHTNSKGFSQEKRPRSTISSSTQGQEFDTIFAPGPSRDSIRKLTAMSDKSAGSEASNPGQQHEPPTHDASVIRMKEGSHVLFATTTTGSTRMHDAEFGKGTSFAGGQASDKTLQAFINARSGQSRTPRADTTPKSAPEPLPTRSKKHRKNPHREEKSTR